MCIYSNLSVRYSLEIKQKHPKEEGKDQFREVHIGSTLWKRNKAPSRNQHTWSLSVTESRPWLFGSRKHTDRLKQILQEGNYSSQTLRLAEGFFPLLRASSFPGVIGCAKHLFPGDLFCVLQGRMAGCFQAAWHLPCCKDLAHAALTLSSELCPRATSLVFLASKSCQSHLYLQKKGHWCVSAVSPGFQLLRPANEVAFLPPSPGAVAGEGSAVRVKAGCKLRENRWFQDQAHHMNEKPNC